MRPCFSKALIYNLTEGERYEHYFFTKDKPKLIRPTNLCKGSAHSHIVCDTRANDRTLHWKRYCNDFHLSMGGMTMSSIRLYNTLIKIPGVDAAEAQEVVDDLPGKDKVATKVDILKSEGKVKEDIAELKGRVTAIQWMVSLIVVMNIGLFVKLFMS